MTGPTLAAAWAAVASIVATDARFPPTLDDRLWAPVASGAVEQRTVKAEPAWVMGVGVLPISREAAWLSLTDDHLSDDVEGLVEVALEGRWAAPKLLYQRLDLPWPFNDRHWVIGLANNAPLASRSAAWERSWSLRAEALPRARARTDAAAFDAAETVTVNEGSWLLVPVDPGHTLAVYQARATLGGAIPDGAVDAYTRSSMRGLFAGVTEHARAVHDRYGPGCTPQPGADGSPIPCFTVLN